MQVPRIDGALVRITTETTRAEPSLALSLGQQVSARVLSAAEGTALLEVAGRHLQARSAVPLAAGQLLQLKVTNLGAEIAFRLVGGGPGVSEHQLALATLATAHGAQGGAATTDLSVLLEMLETADTKPLPAEARNRLAQLLGGVKPGGDAAALAAQLRDLLENSGLLFESRVRAWLEGQPGPQASQKAGLPPSVSADLKVLLGVLGRALGLPGPSATPAAPQGSAPPAADVVGQLARQWLALDSAAAPPEASDAAALQQLRDTVLAKQIETAYHWVRDGTLAMELPLRFEEGTVTARLRFRRGADERDAEGDEPRTDAAPSFYVDFAVEPPGLGPVRAQAHLAGPRLSVRFVVAEPDVGALVSTALPCLREALRAGGIASVRTDVLVDAAQARLADLPPPTLPQGGSVLNARA